MSEIIKGYKVTDADMKCRGFQYEINKEYTHKGEISLCNNGFHFCLIASDCFNYYGFDSANKVFEVEATGKVEHGNDKSVASTIRLVRELTWPEVLALVNTGKDNAGLKNTGDWNTGDWNTGDRNTGNRNTGYWNTGNRNTGNWNTGDWNTGNRNTGDWNTGDWNTGDWNTGDRNTGYSNTGDWNTGNRNTGDWNTGNRNTGYSNTGDRNTGAFCTGEKTMKFFDKDSDWTEQKWLGSKAYSLMRTYVNTKLWVQESAMTEDEKKSNPSHKTAEGYLKDIPFKEAFSNAWHNFSEDNKSEFTNLPNFCWKIFTKITGVKQPKP